MNTRIYYLLLTLMISYASFGQEVKKDSYSKIKESPQNSADLLDDARDLKEQSPKEALDKVQLALGFSITQGDQLNEIRSYLLLGEINESIEEWKLALDNYQNAYEKIKSSSNPKKAISSKESLPTEEHRKALRGLGNTNARLGNYTLALKFLQDALALRQSPHQKAELQLDISEVYYLLKQYAEGLKVLEAIKPGKVVSEALMVRVENQKAKLYAGLNDLDKAQTLYFNSQNTIQSNRGAMANQKPEAQSSSEIQSTIKKEDAELKNTKEEIVEALHEQKRYDEEIDLRNKSIAHNLDNNNLPEVTLDKVGISKALAAKGETLEAIRELEEAAAIADTLTNPKEQSKAYLALAEIYHDNGRGSQALSAYKKYSQAVTKAEELQQTKLVEKSELIQKQKDIEEFTKYLEIGQREETIQKATVSRQRLVIYGLLFIILIIIVTSWFIYRSAQASKTANQLLALKSLRSQMNPHFIFNALNSVNHFVAQNDERTANKFLSEFSRLMRLVLEYSQEDFIPLSKEQEIISLYLKLEHYRFRDKFDYTITIDEDINPELIELPPMLLQPYVENAVWHGLRYKPTKGHLTLNIQKNSHKLVVLITDDGIGRTKSAELKTENQKKHNSTGLKNIRERLQIINKVYGVDYKIDIEDLDPAQQSGTCVRIYLPIHQRNVLA